MGSFFLDFYAEGSGVRTNGARIIDELTSDHQYQFLPSETPRLRRTIMTLEETIQTMLLPTTDSLSVCIRNRKTWQRGRLNDQSVGLIQFWFEFMGGRQKNMCKLSMSVSEYDFLQTADSWGMLDVEHCYSEGIELYYELIKIGEMIFQEMNCLHGWSIVDQNQVIGDEELEIDELQVRKVKHICKVNYFSKETMKSMGKARIREVSQYVKETAKRESKAYAPWIVRDLPNGALLLYEDSSPLVLIERTPLRLVSSFLGLGKSKEE